MNSLISRTNSLGKIFKSKSFTEQFKKNLKNESLYDKVKNSWKRATKRIFDEPTKGNNVTIFFTGDQMFKSMWDCIENAKESISLETYTIEPDKIGNKTIDLLTKAQQRGVKVKFVYDAIGSSSLSDFDIYQMRVNNVEVYQFNPIYLQPRLPYTFRNHRKIMVVDEKYGFCGGMNISGKYASSDMDGGKDYFRDTHCMIEGPGAKQLLNIFHDSFKEKFLVKKSRSAYIGSPAQFAAHFPYYNKSEVNSDFNTILSIKENHHRVNIEEEEDDTSYNDITQTTYQHTFPFDDININRDNSSNSFNNNNNNIPQPQQPHQHQQQQPVNKINKTNSITQFDDEDNNNNNNIPQQHNNNNNNSNSNSNNKASVNSRGEIDEDLTEFTIEDIEEYEGDDDEFREFVTFTNDFHNLESLNNLNNYLIDDKNIKQSTTTTTSLLGEVQYQHQQQRLRLEQEDDNDGRKQQLMSIDDDGSSNIDYKIKSKTVSNTIVQVQESNQFKDKKEIQRALLIALNGSRDHCYFTTPYFLPPRKLRKAIINAAQRGVDIKIMTAGKSDVPWLRNASRYIYPLFLKHDKIRIYEMMTSTLHAKTLSIDGIYCTIGSYNLDKWSQKNLEANLAFFSPQVVNVIEEQFKIDIKGCKEITLHDHLVNRNLLDRLICYLAFQLSKILKPF